MEVVHRADTQDTPSRKCFTDTIHERAAGGAEVVGHHLARGDGTRLAVGCQIIAATDVDKMRVSDAKVRGEHRRRDLAAVGTVADKSAEEAGALGGEC